MNIWYIKIDYKIEVKILAKYLDDLQQLFIKAKDEIGRLEEKRIMALLDAAGIEGDGTKTALKVYEDALSISAAG